MNNAQQLIPVPFYEDTVVLVGQDNEPYVAMKSIVTNIGLDWKSQYVKLNSNSERWGMVIITTPSLGGMQEAVCLPLRKLASWLMGISPNKIKPELRDKIVRYQNECDDALWDYWTKGSATRTGAPNVTQQIALSRHRLALLKELHRARDKSLRAAIHDQLAHTSSQLGLSTPALDSLGWAEAEVPDVLAEFWEALDYLDSQGVAYDHALKPRLLAVNPVQLARLLREQGHPLRFTSELRQAIRNSRSPRFLRYTTVASAVEGKSMKCWLFEKPTVS
jgi:hypothetical protein